MWQPLVSIICYSRTNNYQIGHVQYYNIAPRLSRQISLFAVVFFVSRSLLGIERQKKLKANTILTRKPHGHVRILMYPTWTIAGIFKYNKK